MCTLQKVLWFRLFPWSSFFTGVFLRVLVVFSFFAKNIYARFHLYSFFFLSNLELSFVVIVGGNVTC